jgi:hypothetical protein
VFDCSGRFMIHNKNTIERPTIITMTYKQETKQM